MPNTISDVEKLGYTVGFAHGSVEAEERALAAAKRDAHGDVLAEQAAAVTTQTIADLAAAGRIPDSNADRQYLATRIAEAALDQLTVRATGRIAIHEKAVQAAREMPDVFVISGPGVTNLYVACKDDGSGWDDAAQEILDALTDPDAHKERVKQAKAAEKQ